MLRNLYIICLTVGSLYAVISVLFGNTFDFDFDFDFGLDLEFGSSLLLPIKPFTIMVFLVVFGGVGLIAQSFLPPLLSLLPAIPLGVLVPGLLYHLVYKKLHKYESRAASEEDAIMQKAEVVERIMPDGGYGRISFLLKGNIISGAAREKEPGRGIEKGKTVFILDMEENVYLVCEDLELYMSEKYKI